jgi:hypothetical protein
MLQRIIGVLYLDDGAFKEIEHSQRATSEAALIVVVVALLSGLGYGLGVDRFATGFLATVVWAIVAWFLWAAITYFIGTKLYKGDSTMSEMLRVTGYAHAPRAFHVFAFIPVIGLIVPLLVAAWSLGAAYVGIKEALDLEGGPTIVTIIVGWFVYLIGLGVILALVN